MKKACAKSAQTMLIHPTAVIEAGAELDASVSVGAFAYVGSGVKIGPGSVVAAHASISGWTTLGARNRIESFTSIGAPPQDLKYKGEKTELVIGDDNIIREYVSIHRGTVTGHGKTSIGSHNLIMAYSHIAHDCEVGNHVIMANCATLGGHVVIGDYVNLSGLVAIHQFTRIGSYTYVGGMSGISKDVPPYVIVSGVRNKLRITGINRIGLKRCGYDAETIRKVQKAFVYIFKTPELLLQDALEKASVEFPDCEPVQNLVRFFREPNRMGVLRRVDDDE